MFDLMQTSTMHTNAPRKASGPDVKVLLAYIGCIVAAGGMYHFVAEREFSSVLTVSNFAQCLSFALVLMQIHSTQSVAGISGRSMVMQALMLSFRLSTTLIMDGYLPLDKSGDYVYQIADILSLLMALKVLHSIHRTHRRTYDEEHDTMDVKNLVIGCVALAVVVHPSLNGHATFDIAWAISLYIDTVSLLPQLFLCSKTRRVPAYTAHYLMATMVSRAFSAWFWYYGAENVARMDEGFSWSGAAIILAHVLQFAVLVDFGYYYAKACASGAICKHEPVELDGVLDI